MSLGENSLLRASRAGNRGDGKEDERAAGNAKAAAARKNAGQAGRGAAQEKDGRRGRAGAGKDAGQAAAPEAQAEEKKADGGLAEKKTPGNAPKKQEELPFYLL